MRKIDMPALRKEVMGIVEANREKVTSIEAADDHSIFTFSGENYACEVTLDDAWIGLDLGIDTQDGMAGCGYEIDSALDYDEVAAVLALCDELVLTVKALLSGKVYYTSNKQFSYTAIKNDDGTYKVRYWERKKFLFWPYSSGWSRDDYDESDFKKLKLKALT